jgi:hypothetical protein
MQKNLGAECLDHAEDAVCQKDEWQQPRYPIPMMRLPALILAGCVVSTALILV